MDAEPFELQVLFTGSDQAIWVSAGSRLGSVLALPAPKVLDEFKAHARWFRDTVGSGGQDPGRAKEIGRILCEATFGVPEISGLFRRTRGAAAAAGRPVLLRLFVAPADAATLPWELILDPDTSDDCLALAPDVHLVRTAQVRTYPLRNTPVSPPLNILLILSNPASADAKSDGVLFDHYEEGRCLLEEFQPLVDRGLLSVVVEDRPSLDNLRRRIGAEPRGFHVVHYLGHARPDLLKLESSSGEPEWVPIQLVNELLRLGCPDLRLVAFVGCQTAVPNDATEAIVGRAGLTIADRVVQEACPSVIGMQAVLPFRTEQILTRVFYQALCGGRSIAHALALARAAITHDEIVGHKLLDWAVPLLVTGDNAGPVLDPTLPAVPPTSTRRARSQLKLDLDEPDREFFSRFKQLRGVLDVLTCRSANRVVAITGGSGVGKSRLLARALEELDPKIGFVLYVHAQRLTHPASDGTVDPVGVLCTLVAELLARGNHAPPARDQAWRSDEWWERLIEEMVDAPVVLAIENVDDLPSASSKSLGQAIAALVQRRSRSRVALTAHQVPGELLGDATSYAVPLRLPDLTEGDVKEWVRRNRPRLATVLAGEPTLSEELFRTKLSSRLELWSALASALSTKLLVTRAEVLAAADLVLKRSPGSVPVSTTPPADQTPVDAEAAGARTRPGPLRVVIAGPRTQGRATQFADALARIAIEHGIRGRVVTGDGPDQATSVATLLDVRSPFRRGGTASAQRLRKWLDDVYLLSPDLVLLDFGGPEEDLQQSEILRNLAAKGTLLIAAGGNDGVPSFPAHRPEVLAVGALDAVGTPRTYSRWFGRAGKPDLYASDDLAGDPLAETVSQTGHTEGTSFSALRVVAAAVLVWAVDRSQTATEIRALLVESGTPIKKLRSRAKRPPRQLDLDAALAAARATVVLDSMRIGPLDKAEVGAASGLDEMAAKDAVQLLKRDERIVDEGERYRLTSPGDDAPVVDIARSAAAPSA